MLLVGYFPPASPAAHVLLVGLKHIPYARLGLLLAGYGRDDPGDTLPHAHLLIPYVVALNQVIGAAGPGEGYRPQERRGPDQLSRLEEVCDPFGCSRDDTCPGRRIGGDDQRRDQKDQDDGNEHHLDFLDGLVDHRGEGKSDADGHKRYDGDGNPGSLPEAKGEG